MCYAVVGRGTRLVPMSDKEQEMYRRLRNLVGKDVLIMTPDGEEIIQCRFETYEVDPDLRNERTFLKPRLSIIVPHT